METKARPLALISGGSSGIGLACAQALLARGWRVVLAARAPERLEAARAQCGEGDVSLRSLDVADANACERLVDEVERTLGPIELLVACAGIAEPGLFVEQPLEAHRRHMEVNYFGTLHLVRALAGPMRGRGGGRMVLVSSGAALVGIYGYAAYAPTKFALRGLGEVLQSELAEHGIGISLVYPPDTDTPQYRAELALRPAATERISQGGGLWSAQAMGERIIRDSLAGKSVITPGVALTLLRWVHSLYAPFFLAAQARIAQKLRRS